MASSLFGPNQRSTPLYSTQSNLQQIKMMYDLSRSGGNPSSFLQTMMTNNPNFKSIMSIVQSQYGGDARAAFYDMAKQRGIDPNQVLSMLR